MFKVPGVTIMNIAGLCKHIRQRYWYVVMENIIHKFGNFYFIDILKF